MRHAFHSTPSPRSGRSRLRLATLAAAGALAVAGCSAGASAMHPGASGDTSTTAAAPATTTVDVGIVNFRFTPAVVTVKAGTTVVWTNNDRIGHSVNFDTGGVDSKLLDHGARFAHTFRSPGTYHYICSIHPFMKGTVTVTA